MDRRLGAMQITAVGSGEMDVPRGDVYDDFPIEIDFPDEPAPRPVPRPRRSGWRRLLFFPND